MLIYPAVDIKEGKCVRLLQGSFNDVTEYPGSPLEMAFRWESMGAEYIHVIDLDGARLGEPQNIPVISEMAQKLGIPVQMGGGIRTIEMLEIVFNKGVQRAILGTSAVRDAGFVRKALQTFPNGIAIGIDAREGMVAIEGWAKTSSFTAVGFAGKMRDLGAKIIIYTDISRDGMLSGPNLKAMEEMVKAVGDKVSVIASGGVSCLADIKNLKNTGVTGVIIGKALYTGGIDLTEAIRAAK